MLEFKKSTNSTTAAMFFISTNDNWFNWKKTINFDWFNIKKIAAIDAFVVYLISSSKACYNKIFIIDGPVIFEDLLIIKM